MADHLETYHPNTLFIFHGTAYASRETRHAIQEAKYQHQVSNDRWTRRVSVLDRANMSEEEEETILLPIRPPAGKRSSQGKKKTKYGCQDLGHTAQGNCDCGKDFDISQLRRRGEEHPPNMTFKTGRYTYIPNETHGTLHNFAS